MSILLRTLQCLQHSGTYAGSRFEHLPLDDIGFRVDIGFHHGKAPRVWHIGTTGMSQASLPSVAPSCTRRVLPFTLSSHELYPVMRMYTKPETACCRHARTQRLMKILEYTFCRHSELPGTSSGGRPRPWFSEGECCNGCVAQAASCHYYRRTHMFLRTLYFPGNSVLGH